jgi:hypothetical protein
LISFLLLDSFVAAAAAARAFLKIMTLLSVLAIVGCVTNVPIEKYSLARAAIESAKDAEANRFAPTLWFNAEQSYRDGQRAFRERRYGRAEDLFEDARISAEKAENLARIARHESGDVAP